MENHTSIGFFMPNFALSEGNKNPPAVLFDMLTQINIVLTSLLPSWCHPEERSDEWI